MFLDKRFPYSPNQFSLVRALLGFYLLFYSIALTPYISVLYSSAGVNRSGETLSFFPNLFSLSNDLWIIFFAHGIMTFCALGIIIGYQRRILAFICWYLYASFFGLNVLAEDPALAYIGYLLLLFVIIPSREPYSLDQYLSGIKNWYMPYWAYMSALIVLGVGFTVSGYDKFQAIGWKNGDAMLYLYQVGNAHDTWFVDMLINQPIWMIKIETYVAGLSMLFALPLLLYWRTRAFILLLFTIMFVFILFVLDIHQVTLGMLIFYLFLFDHRWLKNGMIRKLKSTITHSPQAASDTTRH